MIDTEKTGYDYYPEKLAQVVMEHELISPEEQRDFVRYVRGY